MTGSHRLEATVQTFFESRFSSLARVIDFSPAANAETRVLQSITGCKVKAGKSNDNKIINYAGCRPGFNVPYCDGWEERKPKYTREN